MILLSTGALYQQQYQLSRQMVLISRHPEIKGQAVKVNKITHGETSHNGHTWAALLPDLRHVHDWSMNDHQKKKKKVTDGAIHAR